MAVGDGDSRNDEKNSGVAQNMKMYGGKVLRYNVDGTIPADNPFPGSPVWALGFRVPQGMVYASNGNLYTSEHGHITNDEVNMVKKGHNYGYPNVSGGCDEPREMDFCAQHNVQPPIMAWTPTLGLAGIAYYNHSAIPQWKNSLLLLALKAQSLRVLQLNERGDSVLNETVYLTEMFGRLRGICISPDGDVYIATGNRDWTQVEGFPQEKDDRILKISAGKTSTSTSATISSLQSSSTLSPGSIIYKDYCASCHKNDGAGLTGYFPSLATSPRVRGDVNDLIGIVLNGQHTGSYETDMPAFGFLSDDKIANVVEYVRVTFGMGEGGVTPTQVDNVRKKRVTK
jgi:mono/diheme cytochrome c family protein